jgi:VanZ family protein
VTRRVSIGVLAARLAYVAVLAAATLSPYHFSLAGSSIGRELARAFSFSYSAGTAIDAIQNVLLFAGWGALWATTSRPAPLAETVRWPALTGALLSVTAETLQLFIPERETSVLDVMTNTAGAALGAAVIAIAVQTARAGRGQKSYVGLPAAGFAIAYLGAAAAEALLPLQFAAELPTGGDQSPQLHRMHAAAPRLDWTSLWHLPLTEVMLFIPLGIFGVMALVERGEGHWAAARRIMAWGAAGAVLLELCHAPLRLAITPGDALAHLLGIAIGAAACAHWLPAFSRNVRGRGRPGLLLFAYALLIAFWAWRPFMLETDPTVLHQQFALERFIPMHGLAGRSDPASIAEILKPFFLFFPIGGLLAVWPLRRRGWLGGWLPALYLAIVTEGLQGFVSGRYFDGTDLAVQCAAAAIGWAVVRQAGYEPHGSLLGG